MTFLHQCFDLARFSLAWVLIRVSRLSLKGASIAAPELRGRQ